MWMNVIEALIIVIPMLLATTLKGVISAFATLDTKGMGTHARVRFSKFKLIIVLYSLVFIRILRH